MHSESTELQRLSTLTIYVQILGSRYGLPAATRDALYGTITRARMGGDESNRVCDEMISAILSQPEGRVLWTEAHQQLLGILAA